MASPFPGMDPYLESPAYWHGLHTLLIAELTRALNADLPPGFSAYAEELVPDVLVTWKPLSENLPNAGGAAVAERADAPQVVTVYPQRERERFIEIRARDAGDSIVTVVELLSPANKTPGSTGRQEYLRKQQEILDSETHLLEIDLLRQGAPTVAVPPDALPLPERRDYLICLHRADERYRFEFWPNRLRERLPRVFVPLSAGVPDAVLDIQAAFTRAYDAGPYRRDVDYRRDPTPPLTGDDAAWADILLREQGRRE